LIRDKDVHNGIIISFKALQSAAEKIVREINIDVNYNIEYFNIDELIVNISKHVLVPKHFNVSEDEKKKVLA
jgi:DNA-directed RNA polymerase I, II, and III subunit RPABC1